MAERKTRNVEDVLHFLTPQQMAEEIVRLDAADAMPDKAEAPSDDAHETVAAMYRALSRGNNRQAQALARYYLHAKRDLPLGVAMGDCGNAECGWRGPLLECSYVGTVGPCCPDCREIVEPDAAGVATREPLPLPGRADFPNADELQAIVDQTYERRGWGKAPSVKPSGVSLADAETFRPSDVVGKDK